MGRTSSEAGSSEAGSWEGILRRALNIPEDAGLVEEVGIRASHDVIQLRASDVQ